MTRSAVIAALTIATAIGLIPSILVAQDGGKRRDGRKPERRRNRPVEKVQEGDSAPDFELKSLDGKGTVRLSSFRGKKPVALIFGSYT